MQVWRAILHPAKRERLDRAIIGSHHAVHHVGLVEALSLQVVHEVVRVIRRWMATGAAGFPKEILLPVHVQPGSGLLSISTCTFVGAQPAQQEARHRLLVQRGTELSL